MEIITHLGYPGRLIGGSKSAYSAMHPDHLIVFNSNVFLKETNGECFKAWYGDLNINLDKENLASIAKESGMTVIVLREMDGRFERENNPDLDKFVYQVHPSGEEEIGGAMSSYFTLDNGNIKRKK